MKKYILFLFLAFLILNACSDLDDDNSNGNPSPAQLGIVTGINFYDINGAGIGKVGNPNSRASDMLAVYPNPSDGNITIQSFSEIGFTVWIVDATKSLDYPSFDYLNMPTGYSEELLDSRITIKESTDTNSVILNISSLDIGYYRIIVIDNNGNNLIENIYFNPNLTSDEIIAFLNDEF